MSEIYQKSTREKFKHQAKSFKQKQLKPQQNDQKKLPLRWKIQKKTENNFRSISVCCHMLFSLDPAEGFEEVTVEFFIETLEAAMLRPQATGVLSTSRSQPTSNWARDTSRRQEAET